MQERNGIKFFSHPLRTSAGASCALILYVGHQSFKRKGGFKHLVPLGSTGSMYVLIFYQSFVLRLYRTVIILSGITKSIQYTSLLNQWDSWWIYPSPVTSQKNCIGGLPNPPLGGSEPLQHSIPTKINLRLLFAIILWLLGKLLYRILSESFPGC